MGMDRGRGPGSRDDDRAALWDEAISLFRAAHRGDQLAGRMILDTCDDLRPLTELLLQLVEVHLLDADEISMARFTAVAASSGPPPRYGYRPMPRPHPRRAS